jgi:hypothetical protein
VRGGALPPALLCAALGFALAFAPRRSLPLCIAALVAPALVLGWLHPDPAWKDAAFMGCWASVVIAAASVHLPRGLDPRVAFIMAANTGFWAGAVIALAGAPLDLAKSLPWVLLCLPGGWIVARGRQIFIKVAASWLIAVAVLVATLPVMTPTPGYMPDHMD